MSDTSIKEVAKIAGVSIATVSRCINNPEKLTQKTRLTVQSAILRTGYRPNVLAQSFRRGHTNTITIVLASIGDPYFATVVRGIRAVARTRDYSIAIVETRLDRQPHENIGDLLATSQTDGIIMLANPAEHQDWSALLAVPQRVPLVFGYQVDAGTSVFSVGIDNKAAAIDAVGHLIAYGHRRIAMIGGETTSSISADRESGFRSAMSRASLAVDDHMVVDGRWTISGARCATRTLLAGSPRPTAIFCANDEMALGCLHELKSAGISIPTDMSVIGFDDVRYAEITDPPMTTVRQPAEDIGRRVAQHLFFSIEEGTPSDVSPEILAHELIVRQSVTRPPDRG